MSTVCSHTDSGLAELPGVIARREDCPAIGARWEHLRVCQSCGRASCWDCSRTRHVSAHAPGSGHPIARVAESGEASCRCDLDDLAFVLQSA
jgi:hypothetical protein